MTTALDDLITCVVGDIVVLILLEQIIGAHPVAVVQQALNISKVISSVHKLLTNESNYILFKVHSRTLKQDAHQLVRIPGHGVRPE